MSIDQTSNEHANNLTYEPLVTVRSFIMPYEADIVLSLLESEEINAFLMDYQTIYIKWFYSIALGGVKLQVHEQDVELANEIIGSAIIAGKEQALEYRDLLCPNCHSDKTMPVVRGRLWSVVTWLIISMPLVWPWIRQKCNSCGAIFRGYYQE